MAHGNLPEDLLPAQALRAQVLPCLLPGRQLDGTGGHKFVDQGGMGMGDADGILQAHLRVLIFCGLIGLQALQPSRYGTLQEAGHILFSMVAVEEIGQLGQGIVPPAHDPALQLPEQAGVGPGEFLPPGVQRRPDHDDLGIQAHEEIRPQCGGPAQRPLEVRLQGLVYGALHDFRGGAALPGAAEEQMSLQERAASVFSVPEASAQSALPVIGGFPEDGGGRNHLQGVQRTHSVGFSSHEIFHCPVFPGRIKYGSKTAHFGYLL